MAVERGVKEELTQLDRQVASVATRISEARQERRALLANITTCTSEEAYPCCPTVAHLFCFSNL